MQSSSREILEAVRESLSAMTKAELRDLADEHDIDISGLEAKADLVDAIAIYPGIARVLGVDEAEAEGPDAEGEAWEEAEEPVDEGEGPEAEGPMTEEPEVEEPAEEEAEAGSFASIKDRLRDALRASVDFSGPDEALRGTAQRFKGRNYDAAMVQAKDAVAQMEERVHEYVKANWAFAIAAAQRVWDTAHKSTKPAKETRGRLEDAIQAFQDGSFLHARDLLEDLTRATLDLFNHEMEMAREHVEAQKQDLQDIEAMGGDIAAAATMLRKAAETLEGNDRATYLDLIQEADNLVKRARQERIEEIREAADSVEAIIEEARSIGADMDEASDLLSQVRDALEREDFVAAHDLVTRAERTSLETQKDHIDRVSEMRERQVEQVRELIGQIKPLIDEAKSKGFDAKPAAEQLKAAAEHVQSGDYVNALLKAKAAYREVKSFRSQMEAEKLEKAPIPDPEAPALVEEAAPEEEEEGVRCPHCDAVQSETDLSGKVRCESCGKKFRV